MGIIYSFLAICVAGFSLLQATVGLISFKRVGKNKLLFISTAFLVFGIKGIYALLATFTSFAPFDPPVFSMLVLDMAIIFLLYLSILKE
ncbi:MAG: hypothetical protein ACOC53_00555 [Candidatus Saliniplasma sp.]